MRGSFIYRNILAIYFPITNINHYDKIVVFIK